MILEILCDYIKLILFKTLIVRIQKRKFDIIEGVEPVLPFEPFHFLPLIRHFGCRRNQFS